MRTTLKFIFKYHKQNIIIRINKYDGNVSRKEVSVYLIWALAIRNNEYNNTTTFKLVFQNLIASIVTLFKLYVNDFPLRRITQQKDAKTCNLIEVCILHTFRIRNKIVYNALLT